MKSFYFSLFVIVGTLSCFSEGHASCAKPWIFLDLGDTVVDTKTNKYDPMFYMKVVAHYKDGALYDNAKGYIDSLKIQNYPLGMIIDIPEAWGSNYDEKLSNLKLFVDGQYSGMKSSWKDQVQMDWTPFNGLIFLPANDTERKRALSLAMFSRAIALAQKAGCDAIYLGESEEEMPLAEQAGMIPFWIGKTSKTYFYLPFFRINQYIRDYKKDGWKTGSID